MGVRMMMNNGVGLWTRIGAVGAANLWVFSCSRQCSCPLTPTSTTPGLDLRIPKGEKALIGFKDGSTWREHMKTDVTWRAPHLEIEKGKVYANVAIGPRVTLGGALPGTSKTAFDLQARVDLPKFEIAAGQETSQSHFLSYI
jgi:hypothetical protein